MRHTLSVGAALLAAACAGESTQVSVERTDSAGVEIILNRLSPESLPLRQVAAEPVFGGEPTLDGPVLVDVRGLARLGDGRIAVASNGTQSVVILDSDAQVVAEFGQEGEGPGEFASVESVISADDSLLVYDPSLRRLTVFSESGVLGRTIDLSTVAPPRGWSELLPMGDQFVVFGQGGFGDQREPGTFRSPTPARLVSRRGSVVAEYGPFPGVEMVITERLMGLLPFGAALSGTAYPDHLVVGTAEAPQVEYYQSSGALTRIVRWPDERREVSGERFEDFLAFQIQAVPEEQRAATRTRFETLPFSDEQPPYLDLLSTDQGEVWVGDYPGPEALLPEGPKEPRTWIVIAPDGQLRERIRTPAGFEPLLLTDQRVYGVFTDELGVESVRAYRMGG